MIPVIMLMAMTVDGKIAKDKTQLTDWTSPEDKKLFREISKSHGVIMIGANTFRTFPAPLKNRLNVVFSNSNNPPQTGVKWVKGEPKQVLKKLETLGYKSAILGGGASLNSLFLEKKLITEIILTIEPKIFGAGISLFNRDLEVNLKLLAVKNLNNNTLMLRYQVLY